ncbi:MAG: hypothetical protein ACXVC6_07280 [Bacteroidia bacterium]
MKRIIFSALLVVFLANTHFCFSQIINGLSESDRKAVEGIIVEKYYTATKEDAKDTIGGKLEAGSVTYRIYVDLKPGYSLQAVYGVPKHEMYLKTTTSFYNNEGGAASADLINDKHVGDNNVALDSWVTIGLATEKKAGVLKTEDKDGSVLKKKELESADGFYPIDQPKKLLLYGLDLNFFNNTENASDFRSHNGSWASVGGGKLQAELKESNKILIAQLTTTGKLSFELNLQVGAPNGVTMQFVAKNPQGNEIELKQLTLK